MDHECTKAQRRAMKRANRLAKKAVCETDPAKASAYRVLADQMRALARWEAAR